MKAKIWLLLFSLLMFSCSPGIASSMNHATEETPGAVERSAQTPLPSTQAIEPTLITEVENVLAETLPTQPPAIPVIAKIPPTMLQLQSSNLRFEQGVAKMDVCFNTPAGDDWMVYSATFRYQEHEYPLDASTPGEIGFLSVEFPEGYRCETIEFVLQDGKYPLSGTLTVHSLAEALPEGRSCLKFADEVSPALAARGIQVEFTCQEDHGYRIEVTRWPPTLSPDQALRLLEQFYIVEGNWEFNLSE